MSDALRRGNRGFTLIELLIVIAIIAILALIAIPNFLESQVRARVSRVHADMRSIATALESYQVDYNIYLLENSEYKKLKQKGDLPADCDTSNVYSLARLTTPIAYLSTVLKDPFTEKGIVKVEGAKSAEGTRNAYDYYALHSSLAEFGIEAMPGANNERAECYQKGYRWALGSLGPSRRLGGPDAPTKALDAWQIIAPSRSLSIYDPTNGTVSFGFILRTNKGVYSGQDFR